MKALKTLCAWALCCALFSSVSAEEARAAECAALFSGRAGPHGHSLWRTDGTAGGTREVVYLDPANAREFSNQLLYFTSLDAGRVVFSGVSSRQGREPFISDGTKSGTQLLKDIYKGADYDGAPMPGYFTSPRSFFRAGDLLLFFADDFNAGRELWATDGTSGGTVRVKNFGAGQDKSFGNALASDGRRALIYANDAVRGASIWTTDGTSKGTTFVASADDTFVSGVKLGATLGNSRFLYALRSALFFTDGTARGTKQLVKTQYEIRFMAGFPSKGFALMSAYTAKDGYELWKADAEGAQILKNVRPFDEGSDPIGFKEVGDLIYFNAYGDGVGRELWRTDGTTANTRLVADINPNSASSDPAGLVTFRGGLVFTAVAKDGYRRLFRIGADGKPIQVKAPSAMGSITDAPFVLGSKLLVWSGENLYVMNAKYQLSLVRAGVGGYLGYTPRGMAKVCD